jgi:hypothetical protein
MTYANELGSDVMIYVTSFMTIGSGIQVILSLSVCNVGVTDDRDS